MKDSDFQPPAKPKAFRAGVIAFLKTLEPGDVKLVEFVSAWERTRFQHTVLISAADAGGVFRTKSTPDGLEVRRVL